MKFNLMATMASGFEAITAKELRDLGYQVTTENGRVRFTGDESDIVKTNLWLRSADRIKIIVGEFTAMTFEQLFEGVKALPWDQLLPLDAAFPVLGKAVRSQLHSEPDIQAITKRAIVAKLSDVYHRRTRLPETGAKYVITVNITKNKAMLTLDTTGDSLFKRGYRVAAGEAPLKENFAASLVLLTHWHPEDMPFYDPTTGSGTIAIEAALLARHIAPGILRHFSFEQFDWMDPQLLVTAKAAARASEKRDFPVEIMGGDINQNMIAVARLNAHKASVLHDINFKQIAVADFHTDLQNGIIVANPPYGKRLDDQAKVRHLYQQMGQVYRPMTTWSKYILTSDMQFEEYYGQKATKRRKLYNGYLRTDLFQYWGKPVWHHDK